MLRPDDSELHNLAFYEGFFVDDDGTAISTHAVHLGHAGEHQWPGGMPVVVKGSPQRFAMAHCRTVRISKPEVFRGRGETLIIDRDEGVTRHTESSETVCVDDPADMKRATEEVDELNRGAAAIGSTLRSTATGTEKTHRRSTTTTHTYGKNGWIWCAAIEPEDVQQWDAWHQSLGDDYDCVTTIKSPRAFARHLAMMAARQIGPRGTPATLTHQFTAEQAEAQRHVTEHPCLSVFHGPVVYVDDPDAYVASASNNLERMLRSLFFKHADYARQREYRFFVWTETEPEESIVDLEAMPEMLSLVHTRMIGTNTDSANPLSVQSPDQSRLTALARGEGHTESAPKDEAGERAVSNPHSISDREHPSSQPVYVVAPPSYLLKDAFAVRLAAAIDASRQAALDEGIPADLCAAAFHFEWIVARLLFAFVDPIESFLWTDGVLVVTLKTPHDSNATAQMSVGPHGTAQYKITTDAGYDEVSCDCGFMIVDTLIEDLARLGVPTCAQMAADGRMLPHPSIMPQDMIGLRTTQRLSSHSTYSAPVVRMSSRDTQGWGEAEIDAANAEAETGPDDSRIIALVVDGGPGAIFKVHGIRTGLSGTYRQRSEQDQLTIRVRTMNPDAAVEINPPDSDPAQEGHVVTVPDGQDTEITITATSPDGTSRSEVKYVALRSDESEREAA